MLFDLMRPSHSVVLSALIVGSSVSNAAEYRAALDPEAGVIAVDACFAGGNPLVLRLEQTEGIDRLSVNGQSATPRQRITLPASSAQRCVEYAVNLTLLNRYGDGGSSWLVESNQWLYRPRSLNGSELLVSHPEGWGVSLPWPRLERGRTQSRYRFDATPASWPNLNAFGRLHQYEIDLPKGQWRVAVMPGSPAVDQSNVKRWLERTADNLTAVYGQSPLASNQVLVVPAGRGRGPVPWGQVNRGGGAAVHLVINQRRPYRELIADWTAAHEVSHLLLPYLGTEGRWLSEGIASYYQNIARGRTGDLSARQAFDKLHAGLERGRNNVRRGETLRRANQRMRQDGNYMRVYWSGVAFWLQADLALRARGQTLDSVLAKFAACHLPADQRWVPTQLVGRLDEIAEADVFSPLYDTMIGSTEFPALTAEYDTLGLQHRGRRIRLLDSGQVARASLLKKIPPLDLSLLACGRSSVLRG